jgi:hypothetical protein
LFWIGDTTNDSRGGLTFRRDPSNLKQTDADGISTDSSNPQASGANLATEIGFDAWLLGQTPTSILDCDGTTGPGSNWDNEHLNFQSRANSAFGLPADPLIPSITQTESARTIDPCASSGGLSSPPPPDDDDAIPPPPIRKNPSDPKPNP